MVTFQPSYLTDLLERARRRLFGQLVLDKGALALLIGMAAVILLLLTGTQILDWYWPVLVVASAWAWESTACARASRPDTSWLSISTSPWSGRFSFHRRLLCRASPAERQAVCDMPAPDAEIVAQRVDVHQAVPPSRSRYLLPAAAWPWWPSDFSRSAMPLRAA